MFKTVSAACMAIAFVLGSIAPVFAEEQGNNRKGKYTYRKVYKACFERGEVQDSKPPVNPDAHTQAEWKAIFENRSFAEFGCSQEWSGLDETQLKDIFAYLHDHASDSPTPAKCN